MARQKTFKTLTLTAAFIFFFTTGILATAPAKACCGQDGGSSGGESSSNDGGGDRGGVDPMIRQREADSLRRGLEGALKKGGGGVPLNYFTNPVVGPGGGGTTQPRDFSSRSGRIQNLSRLIRERQDNQGGQDADKDLAEGGDSGPRSTTTTLPDGTRIITKADPSTGLTTIITIHPDGSITRTTLGGAKDAAKTEPKPEPKDGIFDSPLTASDFPTSTPDVQPSDSVSGDTFKLDGGSGGGDANDGGQIANIGDAPAGDVSAPAGGDNTAGDNTGGDSYGGDSLFIPTSPSDFPSTDSVSEGTARLTAQPDGSTKVEIHTEIQSKEWAENERQTSVFMTDLAYQGAESAADWIKYGSAVGFGVAVGATNPSIPIAMTAGGAYAFITGGLRM